MIPVACGFQWDSSSFAEDCSVLWMHTTVAEFSQLAQWASNSVSRLCTRVLLGCLILPHARQLPTFFTVLVRLCVKLDVYRKAVKLGVSENLSDYVPNYGIQLRFSTSARTSPTNGLYVEALKTEVLSAPQ